MENSLNLKRLGPVGAIVALVGGFALAAFFAKDILATSQAYQFAWIFWAALTIGCLGLTLLHHTIRATWSLSILRIVEAGGSPTSLAVMGLAFLPILFNLRQVYPWASGLHAHEHVMELKAWYLNPAFFYLREAIYFGIWITLAALCRKSSHTQDETLDPKLGVKRMTVGPIGLIILFVSMTFAATDWMMSLELAWYSSVLPLLTVIGGGLSALSLSVIILLLNREKEPYASIITPQLTKDLGNMLFAFTMLWQYLTLSQFLITWSGNLSEEIPYYLKRNDMGWTVLATLVIVFQFFVPFTALIAPRTKRVAKNLLMITCLIFFMRILDVYWTVMPSMRAGHLIDSILNPADYVAFIALGGLWFALFGSQIARAAILPKHDTRLLEVEHAH